MFFGLSQPKRNSLKKQTFLSQKLLMKFMFQVKSVLFALIYFTRIYKIIFWFLGKFRKRRIGLIITYHFLRDENVDKEPISGLELGITKQRFQKEILFLKKHFMIVPVKELARLLASANSFEKCYVSITFDDAYNAVYERAFPVLKELDIPATIFVPSAYVGGNKDFWWTHLSTALRQVSKIDLEVLGMKIKGSKFEKEMNGILNTKELTDFENRKRLRLQMSRYIIGLDEYDRKELVGIIQKCFDYRAPDEFRVVSWSRLREMSQRGIEIASHTVSHPDVTSLKDDDLQSELEESKRAISEKLSQPVEGMAFPYGKTNLRIQRRAEELGYNYAVTSEAGTVMSGDDRYALKRMGFDPEIPFYYFVCQILKALVFGK